MPASFIQSTEVKPTVKMGNPEPDEALRESLVFAPLSTTEMFKPTIKDSADDGKALPISKVYESVEMVPIEEAPENKEYATAAIFHDDSEEAEEEMIKQAMATSAKSVSNNIQ